MPTTTKRLLWALALSLALHFTLWLAPSIMPPSTKQIPSVIEATLTPMPPARPIADVTQPKRKPVRKPRRAARSQIKPVIAQAPVETAEPPAPIVPEPSIAPVVPPPAAAPAIAPEPPPPEQAPPEPPSPPVNPMPAQAQINFTLYKGSGGLSVGKVVHTWQVRGPSYILTSITEATGVFSFVKSGKLVQTSQGKLGVRGLEPVAYTIQRGQTDSTTETAQFDRTTHMLLINSGDNKRNVPLPEQAQDLLSFIYQLALTAPQSGVVRMNITNARKLDQYDYQVIGEEILETPLGALKTLRLSKVRAPNEDGVDIWLGVDYHYLPVKVKLTDKHGDSVEQVANQITLQ